MTAADSHLSHLLRTGLAALALAAMATPGSATERETLLHRCWILGVTPASAIERKPRRTPDSRLAQSPQRPQVLGKPIASPLRGSIRRVELPPGAGKLIALTFDLCEQPGEVAGYDGPVIDALRQHGIRATLFAGGQWLASHAERSEQLLSDRLFEIGNHGWSHKNVRRLAGDARTDEILLPQSAYELARARLAARQCAIGQRPLLDAVPARPKLYRFPFGACDAAALDEVANAGLLAIQWDVSSGDATPAVTAQSMTDDLARAIKPGSIVLFHANGRGHHTAEALALLIPRLKAQGYRFVTVSELLAAGRPVITPTCYDHRPGDTERYDRLLSRAPAPKERPLERTPKPAL